MNLKKIANNFHSVTMPNGVTVWFSYETAIGFSTRYGTPTVRENVWGPTTGKHLNAIDGGDKEARARRVSGDDFTTQFNDIMGFVSVIISH